MSRAWLLGLTVLLGIFEVVPAGAESGTLDPIPLAELVGEHRRYGLDFLFFSRLAEGELRLEATPEPGVLEAQLIGRTLGVAAWLTGDRTQRYVSRMQQMPDGSLRSLVHESQIIKRKAGKWRHSGKRYTFDYAAGTVTRQRMKDARFQPGKVYQLASDGLPPVDMLTAFFNLRAGVYGPLEPGSQVRIPTFTKQENTEILVNVLTAAERGRYPDFPVLGTLLLVHIDPEVFETGSGNLLVWFSPTGVPAMGVVEDVIGMGDVRGYLEESP